MKKEKKSKEKFKFLENTYETKILENKTYNDDSLKNNRNEFSFKELVNSESETLNSSSENTRVVETYIFRYNVVYSLLYITCVILVLYIFIVFRDFLQNHLNEQLTNTLNTILKYFIF